MNIKELLNTKYNFLFGLISFVMYSLSFLIGYNGEASNPMLIPVKAVLIFVSALLFFLSCNQNCSETIRLSYSVLSLVIFIYEILLFIAAGKTILYIRYYTAIFNSLVWGICSLLSFMRFRGSLMSFLRKILRDRETIFLIISSLILSALIIILSAEPSGMRFCWDSDTLYGFIKSLDIYSLYDARQLMFMRVHVSVVYVYMLLLLKLLLGSVRMAFFSLNAMCIIAASFGMTFLYRTIQPGKKWFHYVLANALFMMSPWVCGMSTYGIYDYFIYCLFPLMIFYYCKKIWIGFFCIGSMITFSRAPGIIVFGGVCLGVLVFDLIDRKKLCRSFGSALISVISDIKYWFFLSVAAVFLLIYYAGRNVERKFGDTKLGIEPGHIFHLVKQYTVCNFLWIFFVLSLITIVCIFLKKKDPVPQVTKRAIFVILFSDLILFIFYSVVITYRIPRYMDSHIAALYICGSYILLSDKKPARSYIVMALICAITFLASFKTIDPLSLALFNTINVGDHRIIDFEKGDKPSFNDSIICNREYYSYEVLMGKTIAYVINEKKEGDDIFFSLSDDDITWGFSGGRYSYGYFEDRRYFSEFYDKTLGGLANGYDYEYYSCENMIPIEIRYIFREETIDDAVSESQADTFYYIYMPTLNCEKEEEILRNYQVESEEEFEFRGWRMNCIRFSKAAAAK